MFTGTWQSDHSYGQKKYQILLKSNAHCAGIETQHFVDARFYTFVQWISISKT